MTFHAQTEPLIAYYRPAGLLREIDGEGALSDINSRCLTALGPVLTAVRPPVPATP